MSYRFFISRLPLGESRWEWHIGKELFTQIGANYYGVEDLAVQVRVTTSKDHQHLRLRLELQGWIEVLCDRGLEPIRLPIQTSHEQIYGWDEYYLPPDNTEEFFVIGPREDTIDLAQSLYDYIGLAIPRRRVRPSCPDHICPSHVWAYLQES
ncbi:MAG: DUF177 domain-containing protein [Bacteroidia bacterium]|nr:DUF177 domain-containing protein [Bacteroidia bacterium]MDW8015144.1 DUF177 domain-containing protein [Bacteroidia bacterium]